MHGLSALVVDDSKVGRLTMMKKLEVLGVAVELAESGQEALDHPALHRPDLIFMDHQMPEMDGFEATRRIKASPATGDIPVIIISGNDDADFLRAARAAGAIDAIAKPPAAGVLENLLASLPKATPKPPVEAPVAAPPPAPEVAPAPAPSVDMAAVHALVERLIGASVAPLRDDLVGELGRRLAEWGQRLERQAAAMAELQTRVDDHDASVAQTAAGRDRRQDAFAEALDRIARDVQSIHSVRAQLAELPERLSEPRLRQLVVETVGSLPPSAVAVRAVAEQEAQFAANQSLQAELVQLKGKVKALAVITAVGGALLLAAIGMLVFGG